jgi:hypothetical protein
VDTESRLYINLYTSINYSKYNGATSHTHTHTHTLVCIYISMVTVKSVGGQLSARRARYLSLKLTLK